MLKKNLFSSMCLLFVCLSSAFPQNVAINADGSPPNPNAMLDVQSSSKGLLIPRVSTSARLAIPNTKGLLVYDTTTDAFWYNTGAGWQPLSADPSGWSLHGNTVDTGNFIGPLNNVPFVVKVNGKISGLIHPVTHNLFWGYGTNDLLTSPSDSVNTAIGYNSMTLLRQGWANTVVGASAAPRFRMGYSNTVMGYNALVHDTTGSSNTVIGDGAMWLTIDGNNNTAIGAGAMQSNYNGNYNTALGDGADVAGGGLSNATVIGFRAVVNASNKVRIGNSAVTVIEGQVPFTIPSDGRFKFDVQEDVKGLDFIRQLRPVTYHFDVERFEKTMAGPADPTRNAPVMPILQAAYKTASLIRRSGFIAQEVEQAAQASGYDFSGIVRPPSEQGHYSLSYESFVVPLVKAVQEQQRQIELLKQEVAGLKEQLSRKK